MQKATRNIATLPWMGCWQGCLRPLHLALWSLVPIKTSGWRDTMWSKVSCLLIINKIIRKQHNKRDQAKTRSKVQGRLTLLLHFSPKSHIKLLTVVVYNQNVQCTFYMMKYGLNDNFCSVPELVLNSMSLALTDFTNESDTIIGVYTRSHPYLY